jgi:hypothetical protein
LFRVTPQGKRGDEFLETQRLARTASPGAMRRLILKMDSEDERVATIAIQGVFTWAFGKPRDYDPKGCKRVRSALRHHATDPASVS